MSERNHSNRTILNFVSKKTGLYFAGTALLLVVGAVCYQISQSTPTNAGVEPEQNQQNAQDSSKTKTLATVNNQDISYDLIAQECVERYGKEVLESVINRVIIQQACNERGIQVTPEEVKQEIATVAERFNLSVEGYYRMLQSERNVSPQQFHRDIIWPRLALRKLAGTKVSVTDEEMKKTFIRDYGPKVKARMILLSKLSRAKQVWEEAAQNPENFEALARKYSIEPNSKALGGSIPPIRRYSGEDTLEKAAFKLQEGQVSGVIQVGTGYAILLCEGRTEQYAEFEDVKEVVHEHLIEEKTQKRVAKIFEQIKKEAVVSNYLTNTRTNGIRQASAIGRKPGNYSRTGTTTK